MQSFRLLAYSFGTAACCGQQSRWVPCECYFEGTTAFWFNVVLLAGLLDFLVGPGGACDVATAQARRRLQSLQPLVSRGRTAAFDLGVT